MHKTRLKTELSQVGLKICHISKMSRKKRKMSNDSINEDLELSKRPVSIIERKLIYNSELKTWVWGKAQNTSKKPHAIKSSPHYKLLEQLFSGKDLQADDIEKRIHSLSHDVTISSTLSEMEVKQSWSPPKLQINETYFVPSKTVMKYTKAKLVKINTDGYLDLVTLNTWEPIRAVLKYTALPTPVGDLLPVGSRVVAKVVLISNCGEVNKGPRIHETGTIAEIPSPYNKNRYLLITDSGFWFYVNPKNIWPVLYQSETIWDILPNSSQTIVKEVLNGEYVHLKNFKRGDIIKYFINNADSFNGFVLNVDASIIIVWFNKLSTSLWIHKGSPQIERNNN